MKVKGQFLPNNLQPKAQVDLKDTSWSLPYRVGVLQNELDTTCRGGLRLTPDFSQRLSESVPLPFPNETLAK